MSPYCSEQLVPGLSRSARVLHGNEEGTTLTEFVITLPIFIIVMVGLLQLGAMERAAGQLWGDAYRDTWTQVLTVLDDADSPISVGNLRNHHINPSLAGGIALAELADMPPRHGNPVTRANTIRGESDVYRNMARGGHWGESYARTSPSGEYVKMRYLDERATSNPADVLGESKLADALFNDSPGTAQVIQGGSSPTLGAMPFVGQAIRPVLAAGMRYGAVMGKADAVYSTMGWEVHVGTEYTVLVPPVPIKRPQVTMAITRQALEEQQPYRELLGIAENQPLRRENAPGGFSFGDD